jgi:hypothetical protein
VKSVCRQRVTDYLNKGRIDLAGSLLKLVEPLAARSIEIEELVQAVNHCRRAGGLIAAGRVRDAARLLQKVKTVVPSAAWLKTALEQTKKAAEGLDALRAGPLGSAASDMSDFDRHNAGAEDDSEQQLVKSDSESDGARGKATREPGSDTLLSSKFTLQVDGVGSFLVLRDQSITVGPISSSARPVLGLLVDPQLPTVTIERTDGDYFVHAQDPIAVNDRPATQKLLDDGDTIALSPKCRFKFHLPNAASTTATLVFSSGRLPRPDIGQIILMDRDILIGPGPSNHIRANQCSEKVTLLLRNGRLFCKGKHIMVNGKALGPHAGLAVNTPIKIGEISLVVATLEQ